MSLARRRRSVKSHGTRRKRGSSSSSRRKWKLNVEEVAGQVIPEVVSRLGLEYLGLSERELRDIIEPIITGIAEARSTKPSVESLVKRIVAGKDMLFKAIAAKLLERDELTREQLEFIVSYAPELAGKAAPRLYREASRLGLDYIVDSLRYLWDRYGKPLPVRCPYCGFRSVTPSLTCIVCGRSIEEVDLKNSINFDNLLKRFAETMDPSLVEEVLRSGIVLYDGELHPPSLRSRVPLAVELFLTRRERKLLEEALARRRLGVTS